MKTVNAAIAELQNQFAADKAVHAYVIEGERFEIKQLLHSAAKIALCKNHGCGNCPDCRKIDSFSHFNHIALPQANRTKIIVDDISYLVEEGLKQPAESGQHRVFTIDACDITMPQSAIWQNKLLKTLEEPPQSIYIFIGTEHADSLLSTILSRCQVLSSKPKSFDNVLRELLANGFNKNICQYAAAMSDGNTENAMRIMSDTALFELFQFSLKTLGELTSTKNSLPYVCRILKGFEGFSDRETGRQKALEFLKILTVILRESLVVRMNENLSQLDSFKTEVLEVCRNYSIMAATECIQKINKTGIRLQNGNNINVEVDNLLIEMLEVRYYAEYSRG